MVFGQGSTSIVAGSSAATEVAGSSASPAQWLHGAKGEESQEGGQTCPIYHHETNNYIRLEREQIEGGVIRRNGAGRRQQERIQKGPCRPRRRWWGRVRASGVKAFREATQHPKKANLLTLWKRKRVL